MFSNKKALPLYYQITEELRKRLKSGNWKEGELFPPDKYWVEEFNVSTTTVRQALAQLVQEGFLYRRAGKGTFVQVSNITERIGQLSGFFDETRESGKTPSARLISVGPKTLDSKLATLFPALLNFNQSRLFLIDKIQCMNNMPVARVVSYWTEDMGRIFENHDLTSSGIYDVLNITGIQRDFADQYISAESASLELAEILEVAKKSPLMRMERLLYNSNKLLEFSVTWYRSDRYRYHLVLDAQARTV